MVPLVPIVLYAPRPGLPPASYAPVSGLITTRPGVQPPPPQLPASQRPLPPPPVPQFVRDQAKRAAEQIGLGSFLTTFAPGIGFATTAWQVGNALLPVATRANMGRVSGSVQAGNFLDRVRTLAGR